MKIYLRDQTSKFSTHLNALKAVPVMAYHKKDLTEKISVVVIAKEMAQLDFKDHSDFMIPAVDSATLLYLKNEMDHHGPCDHPHRIRLQRT